MIALIDSGAQILATTKGMVKCMKLRIQNLNKLLLKKGTRRICRGSIKRTRDSRFIACGRQIFIVYDMIPQSSWMANTFSIISQKNLNKNWIRVLGVGGDN